jgi:hypothetical protein
MATLGIILPIEEKPKKNNFNLDEDKSQLLLINNTQVKEDIENEILRKKVFSFIENVKMKNNQLSELSHLSENNSIKNKNHKFTSLCFSQKIPKSKVGYIKEGYNSIYGINPIDRYNFIIDRYNEDFNKIDQISLQRIPIVKVLRRIYDLYTWVCRLFFGVFLIITYHCYRYRYNKKDSNKNRAGLIVYKQYQSLFNENQDYFINTNLNNESSKIYPSISYIIFGSLIILISIYMVFLFFIVMIIPNILFTLYLALSLIIHKLNKSKLGPKEIFSKMIYENKLDEKGQLNDYLILDNSSMKYYEGCPYFEKIKNLAKSKDMTRPQCFMLYGDLFIREYEILTRAFYKQVLGISGFICLGYCFV